MNRIFDEPQDAAAAFASILFVEKNSEFIFFEFFIYLIVEDFFFFYLEVFLFISSLKHFC